MFDETLDLQALSDGEAQAVVGGAAAVEFAFLASGGLIEFP